MNEMVKNSVEARKQAIYNAYNIDDSNIKKTLDDFFSELEKFASKYNDIMDFENAFQLAKKNSHLIV